MFPDGARPKPADQLGPEVTDDVAEEVAGHDDVELRGIADDLHGQRVDIQVARVDLRDIPCGLP